MRNFGALRADCRLSCNVINGGLFEKTLDFILGIEYKSLCIKTEQLRDVAQFGDVSERRRWRMQRGIRSGATRSIAK